MNLPSTLSPESIVAVPDLLGDIGTDRERFDWEIQRILAFPTRGAVESTVPAGEVTA